MIGRRVTVGGNGKTIINDQTMSRNYRGSIDSKEGEPGPLCFKVIMTFEFKIL